MEKEHPREKNGKCKGPEAESADVFMGQCGGLDHSAGTGLEELMHVMKVLSKIFTKLLDPEGDYTA